MRYTIYLPLASTYRKWWYKRGIAGFTWAVVPPQYRWSGLRISWGHSWNLQTGVHSGVLRLPMVWGRTRPAHPQYGFEYAKNNLSHDYNGELLVMNEPADHGQANLTPSEGVALWMDCCETWPHAKLVGPQMLTALDGQDFYNRARDWLSSFWSMLPRQGLTRIHAHSFHVYRNHPHMHIAEATQWMDWCDERLGGKQYRVTEWGVNGDWHTDGGFNAVKTIAAWYDAEPRVIGHAYYIPHIWSSSADDGGWVNYRLFTDDGTITPRGLAWLS